MNGMFRTLLAAFLALLVAGCSSPKKGTSVDALQKKIDRFAPTVVTADTSKLSDSDRRALHILLDAVPLVDRLYIRQVWSGDEDLLHKLQQDQTPEGRERLQYFMINLCPWSKIDKDEPFIPGVPSQRPRGANYYPEQMTAGEFQQWVSTLSPSDQQSAKGFFTVIRRSDDGGLKIVPYSTEYADLLGPLAQSLRNAAAQTGNASLRTFLLKRADAFASNDYYDSDVAWMLLDSPIDVTIGPYEVYMDDLFNYKAAFEAFITLRNDEETARLAKFAQYLQEIENNLPIAPHYRNPKLGSMAPIRVVDEVATGGEASVGVQTAAYNLPNDERITEKMGSKRVMLRNVQEVKFRKILIPIAGLAVDPSQQSLIAFEPFFSHILAHELMHGLGPHTITVKGHMTTVRQEMKDLSSALEEAKADVAGLFALKYLVDKGVLTPAPAGQSSTAWIDSAESAMTKQLYATYLAGIFRTLRFGIGDAHGKGMVLQANFYWDEGAIEYNATTGTFRVNIPKMADAVRKLTGIIMTIQAEGRYDKATELFERYSTIRPEMQRTLDKLAALPVDIAPRFPLLGQTIEAENQ